MSGKSDNGIKPPREKSWGWSTRLYCTPELQLERITVKAGGFSSIHSHHKKVNQFIVNEGQLTINHFCDDKRLTRCQTLLKGHCEIVEVFDRHQFVACTDVDAYEFYWPTPGHVVDPDDIERFSIGGLDGGWPNREYAAYVCCCRCNITMRREDLATVCVDNALRDMCVSCAAVTHQEILKDTKK